MTDRVVVFGAATWNTMIRIERSLRIGAHVAALAVQSPELAA
jgi:hypothetical protein